MSISACCRRSHQDSDGYRGDEMARLRSRWLNNKYCKSHTRNNTWNRENHTGVQSWKSTITLIRLPPICQYTAGCSLWTANHGCHSRKPAGACLSEIWLAVRTCFWDWEKSRASSQMMLMQPLLRRPTSQKYSAHLHGVSCKVNLSCSEVCEHQLVPQMKNWAAQRKRKVCLRNPIRWKIESY